MNLLPPSGADRAVDWVSKRTDRRSCRIPLHMNGGTCRHMHQGTPAASLGLVEFASKFFEGAIGNDYDLTSSAVESARYRR